MFNKVLIKKNSGKNTTIITEHYKHCHFLRYTVHIQTHFYTKRKLNKVLIKKYRKNYDDSYTHEKKRVSPHLRVRFYTQINSSMKSQAEKNRGEKKIQSVPIDY